MGILSTGSSSSTHLSTKDESLVLGPENDHIDKKVKTKAFSVVFGQNNICIVFMVNMLTLLTNPFRPEFNISTDFESKFSEFFRNIT